MGNPKERNGDIWRLIYKLLDAKRFRSNLLEVDVKFHIPATQTHYRQTPKGHVLLNELPDVAAGLVADHQGLWASDIITLAGVAKNRTHRGTHPGAP